MTVQHPPTGPTAPLGAADAQAVQALLMADTDTNLFLLSTLQRYGTVAVDGASWWGWGRAAKLDAVVWIGRPSPDPGAGRHAGLAVASGLPATCRAIGRVLRPTIPPQLIIGPRQASDALWEGLGSPRPRVWFDQRLYVCSSTLDGPTLKLRPACAGELDEIIDLSARMMAEDLGQDPREEDAPAFARRIRARVQSGQCLVATQSQQIIFKIDVGSHAKTGVQVGGTWVPPEHRGQGLATAGMRAVATRLLEDHRRVTLHVNEANLPAVAAYRSAGFHSAAAFRLAKL